MSVLSYDDDRVELLVFIKSMHVSIPLRHISNEWIPNRDIPADGCSSCPPPSSPSPSSPLGCKAYKEHVCPLLHQFLRHREPPPRSGYHHCEIVVFFIPENEQINRYRLCYYVLPLLVSL